MSSLIPPRQELPTPDPQDVADDRDVARIARMADKLCKELDNRGFAPVTPLIAAALPEIARKVFTDGH